jgi:hypothetical protein
MVIAMGKGEQIASGEFNNCYLNTERNCTLILETKDECTKDVFIAEAEQMQKELKELREAGVPCNEIVEISFDEKTRKGSREVTLMPGVSTEAAFGKGLLDDAPQAQFDELVRIVCEANKMGLGVDPMGDNALYDQELGFSLIDVGFPVFKEADASDMNFYLDLGIDPPAPEPPPLNPFRDRKALPLEEKITKPLNFEQKEHTAKQIVGMFSKRWALGKGSFTSSNQHIESCKKLLLKVAQAMVNNGLDKQDFMKEAKKANAIFILAPRVIYVKVCLKMRHSWKL